MTGHRTNKHILLLLRADPHFTLLGVISQTPYFCFLLGSAPFHWTSTSPQYLYQRISGKETKGDRTQTRPFSSIWQLWGKGSWEKDVKTITKIWGLSVDLNYSCSSYSEGQGWLTAGCRWSLKWETAKLVDPQGNPSLWPLNWVPCIGLFYLMLWESTVNYKSLLSLLLSELSHEILGRACLSLEAVCSRLIESAEFWHIRKITSNSQNSNLLNRWPASSNRCCLGACHGMECEGFY